MILVSRQGKVRLTKWWTTKSMKVRPRPRAPAGPLLLPALFRAQAPALRDVKVAPRTPGPRPGRLQAR